MSAAHETTEINPKTLRVFLTSGFLWQLCWSSYWALFFLRVVVDVGLDPLQLLLLGTTKEITILAVELPTGVVADIRSRRLSVVLAFVICGTAVVYLLASAWVRRGTIALGLARKPCSRRRRTPPGRCGTSAKDQPETPQLLGTRMVQPTASPACV